ncbi:alkaline phosphatase family protein [Kitasatospora sp. Root107]|uniref:alkaline phosphatase family protein n=1 Tax=Kitasatospora sp. Root107 TaxID=1736424 RepID=UPI00070F7C35|nr:alkaline phosphatase family protein [Kitasatospora sp. Root107]KQV14684.1 hypothetical protein ASC99_31620 [Kitasatospora sp. Root107]
MRAISPLSVRWHASAPWRWTSDHALPNGEHLTARLLSALAAKPEVWGKTVFILNYDEHGGFIDHLLPPVPPLAAGRGKSTVPVDGEVVVRVSRGSSSYHRVVGQDGRYRVKAADGSLTWSDILPAGETVVSGPYPMGLGVRVPMVVVSPWTRGGVVDSTVYDHTSVIRFLEQRFGVAEPNISPWRRAVTGDLTSVFDFSGRDPVWPQLPDTSGNRQKVTDTGKLPAPKVPSPQTLPKQQTGTRTARPTPYALQLRPKVHKGQLTLDLANHGKQGAVFAAYPAPGTPPRHYTVGAKQKLADSWQIGPEGYDLRVHGPNGALWHLRGDAAGAYEVELEAESGAERVLEFQLINRSKSPQVFLVGDLAYGGGVQEVRITGQDSRPVRVPVGREGWYDLAVSVQDDLTFRRRYAGRMPGQEQGVTDPAMGLADALTLDVALGAASTTIDEAILIPGKTARVTARFTAAAALAGIEAQPVLPPGWTATVVTAPPAGLAEGATATAEWELQPPAVLPDGAAHRILVSAPSPAGPGRPRRAGRWSTRRACRRAPPGCRAGPSTPSGPGPYRPGRTGAPSPGAWASWPWPTRTTGTTPARRPARAASTPPWSPRRWRSRPGWARCTWASTRTTGRRLRRRPPSRPSSTPARRPGWCSTAPTRRATTTRARTSRTPS